MTFISIDKITLYLIFLLLSINVFAQKEELSTIIEYRSNTKNNDLSIEERYESAYNAIRLSKKLNVDSTILKSQKSLSYLFLINGEIDSLYPINHLNLSLAKKIRDSSAIANANQILGYYFHDKFKSDSAYYYYYKAVKGYRKLSNLENQCSILLNMADIQETERDYIGSEINAINAIEIAESLPNNDWKYDKLWKLNNLLAIASGKLKQYNKSLEYHNKALKFSAKIKDSYDLDLYSLVNIANVHRRSGNYKEAIKRYNSLLKTKKRLKDKDISTYAIILSGLAYAKFLKGDITNSELEDLYRESLRISISEKDDVEIISASLFFSEYFYNIKEKDSALHYVNRAYQLGKELNVNEFVILALELKSKIEPAVDAKRYLLERIKLSDSLQKKERAIRNKFARIEYETEEVKQENLEVKEENLEVKEENLQITRQRLWLLLVTGILAITLFLLYIIKTQREKNKELELAQKQQEFNEEIYNLMLSQQEKIDQGRAQEKKQISQELHDGVLGRLFGVRLSLDSLNFSKTDEAIETRSNYIEELQSIEQDIRKVSHELNTDFVTSSGYFDIVKALVEKQTKAYNLEYSLEENNDINWESLTNKVKMHCYRIIQESLQNVYKHAKGSRVDISFEQIEDQLKLIIKDDGAGFDIGKAKKGIGLKNMYARVNAIKGELRINSKLNKGTELTIQVPN